MSPAGRPEIGTPINVRLGDELLAAVDAYAKHTEATRAQAVRRLIHDALMETPFGKRMTDRQPAG